VDEGGSGKLAGLWSAGERCASYEDAR